MKLIGFHKIGFHKESPRLFLESGRLGPLGFTPGTPVFLSHSANRVTMTLRPPRQQMGAYTVSHRRAAGGLRPMLDICSSSALAPLADYAEAKVVVVNGNITVMPSIRAFHIRKALSAKPPFRVLELFSGGGTLSKAFEQNECFKIEAGMELETRFADVWQKTNPEATLIQADIRMVSPIELPPFEILVAGIPCTDHSTQGRAAKSLAGQPETGNTGDLFIHVLSIVAAKMPIACLFENVPNFGESLAGKTLKNNLRQLGYHIEEQILEPNQEWNEPSNRRRWVCICTLRPGFALRSPTTPFEGTSSLFLDKPDPEQDRFDASRIAGTIAGRRLHDQRHRDKGHGFGFTVLDGSEKKIPTIGRVYYKINDGPFVATEFGPRMLRQQEIERIQGSRLPVSHYATAVEIYGQGVQTRLFSQIVDQLAEFLTTRPNQLPEKRAIGQLCLFAA